jgi:hypothetical protein
MKMEMNERSISHQKDRKKRGSKNNSLRSGGTNTPAEVFQAKNHW